MSTILDEAKRITAGDRQKAYGHPSEHFARVVALVNARFSHKLKEPFEVWEWPIVMLLDKLSRGNGSPPSRDSLVDIAGYARTCEMVLPVKGDSKVAEFHAVPMVVD